MSEESDLIEQMQKDTADVKAALSRIIAAASRMVTINHDAGRLAQSADAMIWRGEVRLALGGFDAAHGVASKALIEGYGAEVLTRGPGR